MKIYTGSQWFSITHTLAVFLVQNRTVVQRWFKKGWATDELFVQTLANISPSKDNIVNDNVRYIDWKRGGLYTFTIDDYDELIQNEKLFARKFGENVDMEIVNKLYEYVSNN